MGNGKKNDSLQHKLEVANAKTDALWEEILSHEWRACKCPECKQWPGVGYILYDYGKGKVSLKHICDSKKFEKLLPAVDYQLIKNCPNLMTEPIEEEWDSSDPDNTLFDALKRMFERWNEKIGVKWE